MATFATLRAVPPGSSWTLRRTNRLVGVAEPAFHGMDQILDPEFWIPLGHVEDFSPGLPSRTSRSGHWLAVIGRLNQGATRSQAAAELETLAKDFAVAYPETDKGVHFRVSASVF